MVSSELILKQLFSNSIKERCYFYYWKERQILSILPESSSEDEIKSSSEIRTAKIKDVVNFKNIPIMTLLRLIKLVAFKYYIFNLSLVII